MNQTTDIQYIRRLVYKFYQGSTSADEEQILANFFSSTPAADIPAELAADAEVFRSLSALSPDAADLAAPTDLAAKLDEIVATEYIVKPDYRKLRHRIFAFAGIAAAACLIWVIATTPAEQSTIAVPAENAISRIEPEDLPMPEDTITAPEIAVVPEAKPRVARVAQQPAEAPATIETDGTDNFVEITDPDEARRIMQQISSLLAANLAESDQAISKVSASFNSYREITKTVLQ